MFGNLLACCFGSSKSHCPVRETSEERRERERREKKNKMKRSRARHSPSRHHPQKHHDWDHDTEHLVPKPLQVKEKDHHHHHRPKHQPRAAVPPAEKRAKNNNSNKHHHRQQRPEIPKRRSKNSTRRQRRRSKAPAHITIPGNFPQQETNPSAAHMTPEVCNELVSYTARVFSHMRYAIVGLSAMVQHGFRTRLPTQLTIACPTYSQEVVRAWTLAAGMIPWADNRPDLFYMRTSDGVLRSVKIKYTLDQTKSEVMVCPHTGGRVLSLRSIADDIARDYVKALPSSTEEGQMVFYKEMRWVLERIAMKGASGSAGDVMLNAERCPHVFSEGFWLPFTLSYPDSVGMFEHVGVDLSRGGLTSFDGSGDEWQSNTNYGLKGVGVGESAEGMF